MMVRFVLCAVGLTMAAVPLGCSSGEPTGSAAGDVPGQASGDLRGSVGMHLTLPAGVQIGSLSWRITGPNGAPALVKSGTVNLQGSLAIDFLVGALPAANDFHLSLSGTSLDGSVTCS